MAQCGRFCWALHGFRELIQYVSYLYTRMSRLWQKAVCTDWEVFYWVMMTCHWYWALMAAMFLESPLSWVSLDPLMDTLKLQSNVPLYINTVIGALAVDACAVTFGTARRGQAGCGPYPVPSSLYQMMWLCEIDLWHEDMIGCQFSTHYRLVLGWVTVCGLVNHFGT